MLFFYLLTRPKCHSRWCTWRKWHIPMAVRRGNRVGGNWLMKWEELKEFPWYTHRLMHRKRVTSELHDSYFCLMTIKHSISKIEWASNDYIIQLSSTSQWSCQWSSRPVGERCGRESHTREPLWSLGWWEVADKVQQITKQSEPLGLRLSIKRTRKTQRDGHKSKGSKYGSLCSVSNSLSQ